MKTSDKIAERDIGSMKKVAPRIKIAPNVQKRPKRAEMKKKRSKTSEFFPAAAATADFAAAAARQKFPECSTSCRY